MNEHVNKKQLEEALDIIQDLLSVDPDDEFSYRVRNKAREFVKDNKGKL